MSSDPAETRKSSKAAAAPRQVALVVPHAAADAGVTFETALEVLDQDLQVHKLWQDKQAKTAAKRRAKSPA